MSEFLGPTVNQWALQWASFSSSEVCRIIGLAGDFPRLSGSSFSVIGKGERAFYDTVALAKFMIIFDLSKLGLVLNERANYAHLAADMLLWYSLLNFPGACEVWGTGNETRWFVEMFRDKTFLVDRMVGVSAPPRYLLRQGNSDLEFAYDLGSVRNPVRSAFYIDLMKAADDLAAGAGRPLCTVEFEEKSGSPRVRRLTG